MPILKKFEEHLFIANHNREEVFRFWMETTEVNIVNQGSEPLT